MLSGKTSIDVCCNILVFYNIRKAANNIIYLLYNKLKCVKCKTIFSIFNTVNIKVRK